MEKEIYETPRMEIVELGADDVIRTSGDEENDCGGASCGNGPVTPPIY